MWYQVIKTTLFRLKVDYITFIVIHLIIANTILVLMLWSHFQHVYLSTFTKLNTIFFFQCVKLPSFFLVDIVFWWVYVTNDNDCITPVVVAQQTVLCLLTTASAESSFASSQKKTLRKNKWAHQTLKNLYASFSVSFPSNFMHWNWKERSITYNKSLDSKCKGNESERGWICWKDERWWLVWQST